MGLMDVIEAAHGPADLLQLLDKFLIEREKNSPPRTGWHPSSFCGLCPRYDVIRRLSKDKGEEFEPGLLRIFDTGHAHHYWYQNEYFGPMKILWGPWKCLRCEEIHWGFIPDECHCKGKDFLYEEIPVKAKLPGCADPVNGHGDGLIRVGGKWYILEIKTINSHAFKWLQKANENHQKQAMIYCELVRQGLVDGLPFGVKVPKPVGILFLYISKNDSELKTFTVDHDENFAREQLRIPMAVEQAMAERKLPPRLPECTKLSDKRAQKCNRRHRCFDKFDFEDLYLIGQNQ